MASIRAALAAEGIRALTNALDTMNTDFGHRGEVIIGASSASAASSTDLVTG